MSVLPIRVSLIVLSGRARQERRVVFIQLFTRDRGLGTSVSV